MPTLQILGLLVLCAGFAGQADGRLLVQSPAVLDPSAPIAQSVDRECGVEALVGKQVFRAISRKNRDAGQILDPAKAGNEKVLKLTILSVYGIGGGGWTGAKSITTRVDLTQNGKTIRSAVFTKRGRGAFHGTCAVLERIALDIGRMVERWLPGALDAGMSATPGIGVVVPAVFGAAVPIAEDVRRSCPLEMLVGNQVFHWVSVRFPGTTMIGNSDLAAADNAIHVTIVGMQGIGGDAIKGMTVKIDVLQNAKLIGSHTFERTSHTGPIDMASACAMFERLGAVLGQSVARWLPTVIKVTPSGSEETDPEDERDDAAELTPEGVKQQPGKAAERSQ